MDLGLKDRVALVAGGSRGIGRAAALALAREGAHVYVLARDATAVDEVAVEIRARGRGAHGVAVDVTDRAALRRSLADASKVLGPPTILVLSIAALYAPERLERVTDEAVDHFLATDLRSAIDLCRLTLPAMFDAKHGRIVVIGSLASRAGIPGATLYATTKAALEGLARGVALDYSRRNVTANVILAGFTETERLRKRIRDDPEARARLERATATRRLIAPEEVGDAVAFLSSARAGSITGAVLELTGGAHLNSLW